MCESIWVSCESKHLIDNLIRNFAIQLLKLTYRPGPTYDLQFSLGERAAGHAQPLTQVLVAVLRPHASDSQRSILTNRKPTVVLVGEHERLRSQSNTSVLDIGGHESLHRQSNTNTVLVSEHECLRSQSNKSVCLVWEHESLRSQSKTSVLLIGR